MGRADEGPLLTTIDYGDAYLAADFPKKKLIPLITSIRAHRIEEFGEMSGHPAEEFTYVLEGTVDFHCAGCQVVHLEQGDCIYFDSSVPLAYVSVGTVDAKILTVMAASHCLVTSRQPLFIEESGGHRCIGFDQCHHERFVEAWLSRHKRHHDHCRAALLVNSA